MAYGACTIVQATGWTSYPATSPGRSPHHTCFQVEQRKVPEFYDQKGKDTISAFDFICQIDDLYQTNTWSDTVTYNNFANVLRGIARKWLFSMVNYLDYGANQLTWTNWKHRFQKQYAVQTNEKLIIEGLANLIMKLNENTCDLLNLVTNTMVILKESYTNYQNKAATLVNDNGNRYTTATAEQWNRDTVNVMQFFKMQLFWAALPSELCHVVAQRDHTTIMMDDMYDIATTQER